jgi:hypothetical protein
MKEFLLVFRADIKAISQVSPDEMQARTQKWMDWIGGIAARGNLVNKGNRLTHDGKVVKSGDLVTDGPYSEIKESVLGYSLIKADNYEEAVELAKGCPILAGNGSVEVRQISPL